MQVGSAAGQPASQVGDGDTVACDDTDELVGRHPRPAPDAGPDRDGHG